MADGQVSWGQVPAVTASCDAKGHPGTKGRLNGLLFLEIAMRRAFWASVAKVAMPLEEPPSSILCFGAGPLSSAKGMP